MAFEYAPAPESRSVVALRPAYGLFVDGRFVDGPDEGRYRSVNPATEDGIAEVTSATAADVDAAVAAARHAYDTVWGQLPGGERAKYLYRIARLIQERSGELAVLETLDGGRPIRESRADLPLVAAHFFYYAGWADKLRYAGLGADPRPLGVAAQVISWNLPSLMLAWTIAPALACGNTVVLKPAEATPLVALVFAEICQQAELPPGVVNIITGSGETGRMLVEHPGVDAVSFNGSNDVGKAITRSIAGTDKRLTLGLGANAVNVVFDDAAVDQAVEGVVNGAFANQRQTAGSRLLVQESIADELLDSLKRRMAALRVGDPLDRNTDVGAMISRSRLNRVREIARSGAAEDAEAWSPPCRLPERGYWFPPTVLTDVSQAHRMAREEVFGPVLSMVTFRTPAEAVEKANNTPFGLAAGVWSEKGSNVLAVAGRLRAGVVWANSFNRLDPASPCGGRKESGNGTWGGRHGLEAHVV